MQLDTIAIEDLSEDERDDLVAEEWLSSFGLSDDDDREFPEVPKPKRQDEPAEPDSGKGIESGDIETPEGIPPPLSRKAIEKAHVARVSQREEEASRDLARFFQSAIAATSKRVASSGFKPDPSKDARKQAEAILKKAFDPQEHLKGLVRAIAPHLAASFCVGAGAELELTKQAAIRKKARGWDGTKHGDHDQSTHGHGGGGQAEPRSEQQVQVDAALQTIDKWLEPRNDLQEIRRQKYRQYAETVLNRMSPKALSEFNANVKRVRFYAGPEELTEEQNRARSQKAEKGTILGCWDGKDQTLHLDGVGREDTYAHEFAHAIDIGHARSKSADWQSAWEEEVRDGYLSDYAKGKPSEGFAEFGRLLWSGMGHRTIKESYPKCYAFWKAEGLV